MFHTISEEEVFATLRAANSVENLSWAAPLLARTAAAVCNLRTRVKDRTCGRSISEEDRGLFFELRYAEALHDAGLVAEYEVAGIGTSRIDFRVHTNPPRLVELVRLGISNAVKNATRQHGDLASFSLRSPDFGAPQHIQFQSEEAEIIKAQERIGQKVFDGKRPIKFPPPESEVHVIMVDARGFIGGLGDNADWQHIANGPSCLSTEYVRYWKDQNTGALNPIAGLFEADCPGRASSIIRERIHAIGFVCEKTFERGEIAKSTFYAFNPHLANSGVRDAQANGRSDTKGALS